ncbi:MAG TPA: hypothetical protein PKN27_04715 [Propionibacteriaceae bacterium]|nr:hypothetical protein [Propionibacteriaceae bacterium]
MILATPFVPGLVDYEAYATALKRRGACRSHVHLVISRSEDEAAAIDFDGETAELFLKSFWRTADPDEEGNVGLANELFKKAVFFLHDYRPMAGEPADAPMLYSDPTWRPSGTQWLNTIQSDYYAKGAPAAMGRFKISENDDKVIWGPVVLGRAYARSASLLGYLPANVHWRHYLRHEIGKMMEETSTIGTSKQSVLKPPPKK